MESRTPIPPLTDIGEIEARARRNLGLDGGSANGLASSLAQDPTRLARQAIRSQTAARDYAERQLEQAQGAVQDLRVRLHHVHRERDTAIAAAQSAVAAKANAERAMRAAELALTLERGNRVRVEAILRDADAMVRDLREKLAAANQDLRTVRAELAALLPANDFANDRPNDGAADAPAGAIAAGRDGEHPVAKRPVGRPRKTVETIAPIVRRPVGRPRKIAQADPVPSERSDNRPTPAADREGPRPGPGRPRKASVPEADRSPVPLSRKSGLPFDPVPKIATRRGPRARKPTEADQQPVQWWIDASERK